MILRRLSAGQIARVGARIGSVGFLAVGPIAVMVRLPRRFEVSEPTLLDLNEHLRATAAAAQERLRD